MTAPQFKYTVLLNLSIIPKIKLHDVFPRMADVGFESRLFDNHSDCIDSARQLMDDLAVTVNENEVGEQFSITAEVNPEHSNAPADSDDWEKMEIARFWLFNERHLRLSAIQAAGRARIHAIN